MKGGGNLRALMAAKVPQRGLWVFGEVEELQTERNQLNLQLRDTPCIKLANDERKGCIK